MSIKNMQEEKWHKNLEVILNKNFPANNQVAKPMVRDKLKQFFSQYDVNLLDTNFFYPHLIRVWYDTCDTNLPTKNEIVGIMFLKLLSKEMLPIKKENNYDKKNKSNKIQDQLNEQTRRIKMLRKEIKQGKGYFISDWKNMLDLLKDCDNLYINKNVAGEIYHSRQEIKGTIASGRYGEDHPLITKYLRFLDWYFDKYMMKALSYLEENNKVIEGPFLSDISYYDKRFYNKLVKFFSSFENSGCSETDESLLHDAAYISSFGKSVSVFSFDEHLKNLFYMVYSNDSYLNSAECNKINKVTLIKIGCENDVLTYNRRNVKKAEALISK